MFVCCKIGKESWKFGRRKVANWPFVWFSFDYAPLT